MTGPTSNLDAFRDRIDAYFGPRKEGVLKTPYFLHETEWIELRKAFVSPVETPQQGSNLVSKLRGISQLASWDEAESVGKAAADEIERQQAEIKEIRGAGLVVGLNELVSRQREETERLRIELAIVTKDLDTLLGMTGKTTKDVADRLQALRRSSGHETQPVASDPDAYLVEQPDGWRYLASTQQDAELTQKIKGCGVIVPLYRRSAVETTGDDLNERQREALQAIEAMTRYATGTSPEQKRLAKICQVARKALGSPVEPRETSSDVTALLAAQQENKRLRGALARIASGTPDLMPPYRADGPTQLRDIAIKALQQRSSEEPTVDRCALIDGVIHCQCGKPSSHYGTMGVRGAREVREVTPEKAEAPARELSASEAASFDKTLARSPRRIESGAPRGEAGDRAGPQVSPLPPEVLADALQDVVHVDNGPVRAARSVKAAPEPIPPQSWTGGTMAGSHLWQEGSTPEKATVTRHSCTDPGCVICRK